VIFKNKFSSEYEKYEFAMILYDFILHEGREVLCLDKQEREKMMTDLINITKEATSSLTNLKQKSEVMEVN